MNDLKLKHDDLNKISQMKPSEFAEKYLGVSLFDYQKTYIDKLSSMRPTYMILPSRGCNKRIMVFLTALQYLDGMKDEDEIIILNYKNNKKMNKKEFTEYLLTDFWK